MKIRFLSQNGSSLVAVMTGIALVAAISLFTMNWSARMGHELAQSRGFNARDQLLSSLRTLLSDPETCMGVGGSPFSGVRFVSAGGTAGQDTIDGSLLLSSGQKIELGTHLGTSHKVAKAGETFDDFGIRIESLVAKGLDPDGGPDSFSTTLVLTSTYLPIDMALGPIEVGRLLIQTVPGPGSNRTLVRCAMTLSSNQACAEMGCVFNPTSTVYKCECPVSMPALDCSSLPDMYVAGYVTTPSITPLCKSPAFNCQTMYGADYFFAGFNSSGNPICRQVYGP